MQIYQAQDFVEIFRQVKAHRSLYFSYGWIDYEQTSLSNLTLALNDELYKWFEWDHKQMQPMIFGNFPPFDSLLSTLSEIEVYLKCIPD